VAFFFRFTHRPFDALGALSVISVDSVAIRLVAGTRPGECAPFG
jgi:hypothetical protein